jgi:predicted CXXCH cytochrome family protein
VSFTAARSVLRPTRGPRSGLTAAALAAAAVTAFLWLYIRPPALAQAPGTRGISDSAGRYADPLVCAQCHPAVAASFHKTGMGRSFYRLRPENAVEDFTPGKTFKSKWSDDYFAMITRDGKYFQRRWQIGFDGRETNIDEKQVDFVIGSGNHARSYVHLTDRGTLQELPLGWYAEKGGYWAMNPGYDRADYPGSIRPVYYECMFCHNGYPNIPEGRRRDPAETVYLQPLPEGVDCQRCHGPGQRHVDKAVAKAAAGEIRAAIVNPARLNPERQLEVCMQCHLETSVGKLPHSIRRFDRSPFSYVPGEALGDFSIAFNRKQAANDTFEVAQGAYRLRQSQCFLKSAGKLTCTTCHNPHDIPRGETANAHYNGICTSCHAAQLARLTAPGEPASGAHATGADCVSCHMPKRRTDDAVHIVMTDHLIARRPPAGDLLADKPEVTESAATAYRGEVVPYYPAQLPPTPENALYLAVAQVRDQSNLTEGLPQLKKAIEQYHPAEPGFYAELAQGYLAAGNNAAAISYFEEAARREPSSASRLIQLADALTESRQWAKAELQLRSAAKLSPDDPRAWGRLGWALWQQDKAVDARAALEKAVSLDPEIPEIRNNLGLLLWGTGDQAGAEKEFRAALRIQPGVAEWRLNLGRALATQGQTAEARYQMEQSVKLKPDYTEARLDYARLLAELNQPQEAEAQARAVVAADPRGPLGHELLGGLLADKGDMSGASSELQTAIGLQPDFWRAQFELGIVLGAQGDSAGAVQHLRIAAQGRDPQASAAAKQALQRLGQ